MKNNPFQGKIDVTPLIEELLDIQFDTFSKSYLEKYPMDEELINKIKKYPKNQRNNILKEAIDYSIRIKDTKLYKEKEL
ncbi:MAG: hypothetical protein IJH20_04470 [Bacilli bacterium]|nr:hypothetical protein [Bacilli bacterium]